MLTQRGKDIRDGKIVPPAFKAIPPAQSEREWDFMRAVALELILAYRDADPAIRPLLERAMFNVGIEREGDNWVMDQRGFPRSPIASVFARTF